MPKLAFSLLVRRVIKKSDKCRQPRCDLNQLMIGMCMLCVCPLPPWHVLYVSHKQDDGVQEKEVGFLVKSELIVMDR